MFKYNIDNIKPLPEIYDWICKDTGLRIIKNENSDELRRNP